MMEIIIIVIIAMIIFGTGCSISATGRSKGDFPRSPEEEDVDEYISRAIKFYIDLKERHISNIGIDKYREDCEEGHDGVANGVFEFRNYLFDSIDSYRDFNFHNAFGCLARKYSKSIAIDATIRSLNMFYEDDTLHEKVLSR